MLRYVLSRRVYDFDRKEFHWPSESLMRKLRSGIIQSLEIDEKLLATDFSELGRFIGPYMKHNLIPKEGVKGVL